MKIDTCIVEGWEIFMNENEISMEEMLFMTIMFFRINWETQFGLFEVYGTSWQTLARN
jgi:hypothetical protein